MFIKFGFEEEKNVSHVNFMERSTEDDFLHRSHNTFVFKENIYVVKDKKVYKIKNTFETVKMVNDAIELDKEQYKIENNALVKSNNLFNIENTRKDTLVLNFKNTTKTIKFDDSIFINNKKVCENEIQSEKYLGIFFVMDDQEIIVLTAVDTDTFLYFRNDEKIELEEKDILALGFDDKFEAEYLEDMFYFNNKVMLKDKSKLTIFNIKKDDTVVEDIESDKYEIIEVDADKVIREKDLEKNETATQSNIFADMLKKNEDKNIFSFESTENKKQKEEEKTQQNKTQVKNIFEEDKNVADMGGLSMLNENKNTSTKQNLPEKKNIFESKKEIAKLDAEIENKKDVLTDKLLKLKMDENNNLSKLIEINDLLEKDVTEVKRMCNDVNITTNNTIEPTEFEIDDGYFDLSKLYNKIFNSDAENSVNETLKSMLVKLNEFNKLDISEITQTIKYFDKKIQESKIRKGSKSRFKNIIVGGNIVVESTAKKYNNIIEGISVMEVKQEKIVKVEDDAVRIVKSVKQGDLRSFVKEEKKLEFIEQSKEVGVKKEELDSFASGIINSQQPEIKPENAFTASSIFNSANTALKQENNASDFNASNIFGQQNNTQTNLFNTQQSSNIFDQAVQQNKSNSFFNNTKQNTNDQQSNTNNSSAFSRFANLKKF